MPRCKFVYANRRRCASNSLKGCDLCSRHAKKEREDAAAATDDDVDEDIAMLPMPPDDVRNGNGRKDGSKLFDDVLVDENMKLKTDVARLTNELNRLTVTLTASLKDKSEGGDPTKSNKKARSKNPPTEKKVWRKARFMYYNEVKTNVDILANILARLKTCDLIQQDAGIKDIPWLNVKKVSDHMFDGKDVVEKKMYYDVAHDILTKRVIEG